MRKILCLILLIAFLPVGLVLAKDSRLLVASPAKLEILTSLPSEVNLSFSQEITSGSVSVYQLPSKKINVSEASVSADKRSLSLEIKSSEEESKYTVLYGVQFSDGQVETGSYDFAVGENGAKSILGASDTNDKASTFWLALSICSGLGFLVCFALLIRQIKSSKSDADSVDSLVDR